MQLYNSDGAGTSLPLNNSGAKDDNGLRVSSDPTSTDIHAALAEVLGPDHRRMLLEESGISPEDVLARGYFTATDPD